MIINVLYSGIRKNKHLKYLVELCFNTNFALTKISMLGNGVKANFEMWLAMRGVIGGLPLMPLNLYSMSAVASWHLCL